MATRRRTRIPSSVNKKIMKGARAVQAKMTPARFVKELSATPPLAMELHRNLSNLQKKVAQTRKLLELTKMDPVNPMKIITNSSQLKNSVGLNLYALSGQLKEISKTLGIVSIIPKIRTTSKKLKKTVDSTRKVVDSAKKKLEKLEKKIKPLRDALRKLEKHIQKMKNVVEILSNYSKDLKQKYTTVQKCVAKMPKGEQKEYGETYLKEFARVCCPNVFALNRSLRVLNKTTRDFVDKFNRFCKSLNVLTKIAKEATNVRKKLNPIVKHLRKVHKVLDKKIPIPVPPFKVSISTILKKLKKFMDLVAKPLDKVLDKLPSLKVKLPSTPSITALSKFKLSAVPTLPAFEKEFKKIQGQCDTHKKDARSFKITCKTRASAKGYLEQLKR